MELIKFKEYLMTIVNELSIKLNEIETEISSLPPIKEFDNLFILVLKTIW